MKVKPEKTFYILGDLNLDGTIDIETMSIKPMKYLDALEQAHNDVNEHGGSRLVIKCECVSRIQTCRVNQR